MALKASNRSRQHCSIAAVLTSGVGNRQHAWSTRRSPRTEQGSLLCVWQPILATATHLRIGVVQLSNFSNHRICLTCTTFANLVNMFGMTLHLGICTKVGQAFGVIWPTLTIDSLSPCRSNSNQWFDRFPTCCFVLRRIFWPCCITFCERSSGPLPGRFHARSRLGHVNVVLSRTRD